jgi:hypothetical protein
MPKVITSEIRKRGIFGKICKWLFIIFNVLMGRGRRLLGNGRAADDEPGQLPSRGSGGHYRRHHGETGALLVFWAMGAAVLGRLAMATRGKKIITQETIE